MILLLLGLVLFLGVHSVSIVSDAWRARTIARLGEPAFKGLYALLSLVGFVLIVQGYGAARMAPVVIYAPPVALRHLALLLMLPVFPLLLAAYLPGRIQRAARHPMLVATKLWALAHLLANGTLADLALFGGFLAWAVVNRISLKRRTPRAIPALPASHLNDVVVVVAGLAAYAAFAFWAHPHLIGVNVMG